jgi:osmoprotectant transport system substrate-binding protein
VRKLLSIAALVLVIAVGVVGVSGCGSSGSSSEENKPTIIVSSKPPTEAMLLGTMTYMYLEELGTHLFAEK